MFLNGIGQPVLYERFSEMDLVTAPLLLCSAQHFRKLKFPPNYRGILYTSAAILEQIRPLLNLRPQIRTKVIQANKEVEIVLPNGCDVLITMLPIVNSESKMLMFFIKDVFSLNLLAICRSDHIMDTFWNNKVLFMILSNEGIETLYIDDATYADHKHPIKNKNKQRFTRVDLIKLVHIVSPRHVIGISGAQLPGYLHQMCRTSDCKELSELH